MGRPKRTASVTIPLSPEDEAWLKGECQRLGGDIPNLCQIIIRSRPVILGVGTINSENGTSSVPNSKSAPPNAALIAGLSDAEYDLAMELSQEELIIAHQTVGIKQYVAKLQSHATAVEARLARGGLNGGVPIAPLSQMSASRAQKIADGAA
jgi:pyruvate/oxaloacetate carboxyltransferase